MKHYVQINFKKIHPIKEVLNRKNLLINPC